MKENLLYEFNDFRLEVNERRLKREHKVVALTPKAFETLLVLIQNKGKAVEKEFLLDKVWGDTFVEEATLTRNISTLRKALGKQSNGESFIETVPRFGYRFVAEVKEIRNPEAEVEILQTSQPSNNSKPKISLPERHLLNANESDSSERHSVRAVGQIYLVTGFFCIIVLLIGIWLIVNSYNRKTDLAASKFQQISFSKLNTSGDIQKIALSPDGKYLAYVENKGKNQALILRQLANENFIEVVPAKKQIYTGITFSPDGNNIFYVAETIIDSNSSASAGALYKVSVLGGAIEKIIDNVYSPAAISPVTNQIAFIRSYPGENESALIVADSSGKNERKLAVRNLSEPFAMQKGGVSWSPDESLIITPVFGENSAKQEMQLIGVHPQSGEQEILTSQKWAWIGQPAWLKDGSGILFPATDEQSQNLKDGLWLLSRSDGRLRHITEKINGFFGTSLTADSNEIAAVQSERLTTFWNIPVEGSKQPVKIAQSFSELSFFPLGLSYFPDGRIIYCLAKNGNVNIWTMNGDGNEQKQLTSHSSADFEPAASSDGRLIVYLSNQNGSQNIWRMNSDGTNSQQLTNGKNINSPSITSHGAWIYYAASEGNNQRSFIWRMPATGGAPEQITFTQAFQPKISPDGKLLACFYPDISDAEASSGNLKLTVLSADNGKVIKQFDEAPARSEASLAWTPDNNEIIFLKKTNGVSNIWRQPITETRSRQLTASTDSIVRFAISPDGKTLTYEKGLLINNIVLIHEL